MNERPTGHLALPCPYCRASWSWHEPMVWLEGEPTRVWLHPKNRCLFERDHLPMADVEEYNRVIARWPNIEKIDMRTVPSWRSTLQFLATSYRAGVRYKKPFWPF